jgi:peptidoglycan/LPS O-acetylase OafA/YrhL
MVLAAIGDLSVILRRGIAGTKRIARHLWRMCFGMFIAVGSFAAQGAKILPPGVGLWVLLASMLLILSLMLYWLVRVLFTRWYERAEQVS